MICAVTFSERGRLYYAEAGEHSVQVGDFVLFPTDSGAEVAQVVWAPEWVSEPIGGLAALIGLASDTQVQACESDRKRRAHAMVAARKLVRLHELPMKISGIDYSNVDNITTVYFSAPRRVDFRALVRDLAATLQSKVDLRQISARDEAKLIGGLGSCGRELCCSTFLADFEPVSVRMAREQDLPVNPLRISGACGKLMCCLKYEHPLYQDAITSYPDGLEMDTPDGPGEVVGRDVVRQQVVIRLDATGTAAPCAMAEVCPSRQAYEKR